MSAKSVAALLMILIAPASPGGQRGAPAAQSQAPEEPTQPTRISAIITDRLGRPVTGLTVKDFEIRDDGVVQKLESIEQRKPQPRRLALLLDEFHVAEADAPRVREALTRFVGEDLRNDDQIVVLKPLDSLPSIALTSDREEVRQSVATFEGRAGNYTPRTPLEEQTVGRAPALAESARAQIVLSAMRALASRVGTADGRAAIILVSEGFDSSTQAIAARALPDLGNVERFANRYDVPVYAIDPRALAAPPPDETRGTMLRRVASQTGGSFSMGADLTTTLKQLSRELDGGYVLSYRPPHGDDGKYHSVDVRVLRRQAQVRTRVGYISPPSTEMRRAMRAALAPPSDEPRRTLRRSPMIDVWSGVTRAADARGRIVVTWEPGRYPGSTKSLAALVELKATTKDGTVLFDGTLAPIRRPIGSSGLPTDRAEFDAPTGRVMLDMTVLGERGEKLDQDARDLEVPNLKAPGTLLLPPILLATQSAREFRDVTADEDAVPGPGRQFRRTERLLIRVPAYGSGGIPAPVTARLLNRVGQPMRDLEPIPGQMQGVTQFDLPLAPLAPGEYFLLLTAGGNGGTAEQRISFTVTG